MKNEKFLPIGSVVLIKKAQRKLMIIGYCSTPKENERKLYDYVSVLFPEGLIKLDQVLIFNHDDIVKTFHMGYHNSESQKFNDQLHNFVKNNVDSNGYLKMNPSDIFK